MGSNAVRNKVVAILIAVVMAVAVAACGGGGDDVEVQSTSDEVTTTERDASTENDSSSDRDLDGLGLGGLEGDCAQVALAYTTISLGVLGSMFGGAVSDTEMQEMEDQLAEFEADIPDEIADDFDVMRDAFAEFAEATSGLSGNILDPGYQDQLEAAGEALESPEVEEAQANIEAYLEQECPGFTADSGS